MMQHDDKNPMLAADYQRFSDGAATDLQTPPNTGHNTYEMIDRNASSASSKAIEFDRRMPGGYLTSIPKNVQTLHEAQYIPNFFATWCTQWDYQPERKYFHVLENAYEVNEPFVLPTFMNLVPLNLLCCYCCNAEGVVTCCFKCGLCNWVPPNSCCTSNDAITKVYYDRGVFDRQIFCFKPFGGSDPVFSGPPTMYYGPAKYVCCCIACPDPINEWIECHPSCIFGEAISVRPCSAVLGCELTSTWCCNCCELCGVKSGEPLCLRPIPGGDCLKIGESEKLADALNRAHVEWRSRVGKRSL